jgi:pimeloyl-ACP methyl ester carboxylesterase
MEESVPTTRHVAVEEGWQQLGSRPVRALRAGAPHAAVPEPVLVAGLNVIDYLLPIVRICSGWTRVHLLDVPGFGHRRTSQSPSALTDIAEVIAEWLAATDLPRAVLLGHSTGAQATIRAARAAPRHAEAVVLAGPTFPPAARRWWPLAARVARTLPHEALGEVRAAFPEFLHGRSRVLTFLRTAMSDAPERLVRDLPCPVVIIRAPMTRWPTTSGRTAWRPTPNSSRKAMPTSDRGRRPPTLPMRGQTKHWIGATMWAQLRMTWSQVSLTIATAVGVYAAILALSRLFGQRQFASLSTYDLASTSRWAASSAAPS